MKPHSTTESSAPSPPAPSSSPGRTSGTGIFRAAISLTILLLAGAALTIWLTSSPPLDHQRASEVRGLALAGEAVLAGLLVGFTLGYRSRRDRVRARLEREEVLRQSEETFTLLVRSVKNYAIILLDPDGNVASWNEGAERITGYTADEILGDSIARFFPAEDVRQGKPQRQLAAALAEGRRFDQGWRVRKDGSRYWTEASLTPLFDRQGTLRGYAKVTRDVTERRAAEERLRRSESLLSDAQRTAHLGSWVWDIPSDQTLWSAEFLRILGLDPGEAHPQLETWLQHVHPDDLQAVQGAIQAARQDQRAFSLEHRIVREDGNVRILATQGHVEVDESGRTVRLVGTGQDITGRKQMEEALRIQTELYLSMLNAQSELGEGVLLSEGDTVIYANPALGALFGLEASPPRSLGSFLDGFDPGRTTSLRRDMELHASQGLPPAGGESTLTRKDGRRAEIGYVVSAVAGAGRLRTFALFRDETERRRAVDALQESREQLRRFSFELGRAREVEAARISREIHDELGQQLTGLKLDLAWLAAQLGASRHESDSSLLEKARSMSDLIDLTIDQVRRIASELRPGVLDDLGLSAALEWQASEFETRTGIRCHVQFDADAEAVPPEHATAMFRIFQEALTNVARHAQAKNVTVVLEKQNGAWLLTVEDDGRGITDAELQASGSLGLLGMRERAHLLGGETTIRRGDPSGTVLSVALPLGTAGRVIE